MVEAWEQQDTSGAGDLFRRPAALRDLIYILGEAGDFHGARAAFERAEPPRKGAVWRAMLRVCDLKQDPAFSTAVLFAAGEKADARAGANGETDQDTDRAE